MTFGELPPHQHARRDAHPRPPPADLISSGDSGDPREAQPQRPAGALGRLERSPPGSPPGREGLAGAAPPAAVFAPIMVSPRARLRYPAAVTAQMVAGTIAGGAAVNQLCQAVDADLRSTRWRSTHRPRLHRGAGVDRRNAPAMAYSMMAVRSGIDLLALGEMECEHHRCRVRTARFSAAAPPAGSSLEPGRRRRSPAKLSSVVLGAAPSGARRSARRLRRLSGLELAASRAPSWRRGSAACQWCSTAMPARPQCRALRRRSAGARSLHRCPPLGRTGPTRLLQVLGKPPVLVSACGSAKARARRWRSPSSTPLSPAIPAWRPSPRPASARRRTDGARIIRRPGEARRAGGRRGMRR